ncbi:MAG TPA: zf-TFIIB domain-containing protein [Candidatus Brocadiia bacterium]|nr:zf-TFIIB domain-containing protein [Candidatus Brocadiia bacterium]
MRKRMICPVCNEEMIVVEHKGIELDYCVGCEGIWFDETELDLLFKSLELAGSRASDALSRLPTRPVAEKPRKCPICRRRMVKTVMGDSAEVLIDGCPDRHGLWFDGGELGQVIQQLLDTPGEKGKVVTFLGNTFKSKKP